MSIFDKINDIKKKAVNMIKSAVSPKETFTFSVLPESLSDMQRMPEATLDSPYKTAALTVCALCAYSKNKEVGVQMLDFLRGPRPLSPTDLSFLNDRFMDGQNYIPFSFFNGATPQNDYAPDRPYTLTVTSNQYSDDNKGYKKLYVQSGGADSLRAIILRQAQTGVWYLWEQELLSGIRKPASQNLWK